MVVTRQRFLSVVAALLALPLLGARKRVVRVGLIPDKGLYLDDGVYPDNTVVR